MGLGLWRANGPNFDSEPSKQNPSFAFVSQRSVSVRRPIGAVEEISGVWLRSGMRRYGKDRWWTWSGKKAGDTETIIALVRINVTVKRGTPCAVDASPIQGASDGPREGSPAINEVQGEVSSRLSRDPYRESIRSERFLVGSDADGASQRWLEEITRACLEMKVVRSTRCPLMLLGESPVSIRWFERVRESSKKTKSNAKRKEDKESLEQRIRKAPESRRRQAEALPAPEEGFNRGFSILVPGRENPTYS